MDTTVQRLCHRTELADGAARGFGALFVVRRGERLLAYRDSCPHWPGTPLAWRRDAYLNRDGSRIVCSAHGAQFDVDTGRCVQGPCEGGALTPLALQVDADGTVHALLPAHEKPDTEETRP